jgi:Predicted signal transduction protein with a C-terminal ATPase domain
VVAAMKQNSYISKLFALFSLLIAIVAILLSVSIYNYSQVIIGNEMANLNNAVLSQVSDSASKVIVDSITLCNKIAYDSKLIDYLEAPVIVDDNYSKRQKEISDYVKTMAAEDVWSQSNYKNLFEAYVIGYNGTNYTTYSQKYTVSDIQTNPIYKQAFSNNMEAVLINTTQDTEETGVYRYTYQVVREIRDHITKVPCGFVILNISEKVLNDSYKGLISNDKKAMIVDENGIVLSSKDKRLIGEEYINFSKHKKESLKESGYTTVRNKESSVMLFYNRIQGTKWYLIEEMNLNTVLMPLKNIKAFVLAVTLICIGLIFLLSKHFAKKTSEPIASIRSKMEHVTNGDLGVRAVVKNNDEFGHIAKSFNEMVEQINNLLMTVKKEEFKKRMAELDFLRAQINPHFIYNTLSSIRFYVEMNKNAQAEEMLFHFSKILRNTLSRSDEFIKVKDEIKMIDDYVQLQKLRYTGSFEVVFNISERIKDYLIPAFILQPLVENSIFYSVGQQNAGFITITGDCSNNTIMISIKDNGIGMSRKQVDNVFNKEIQVNKVGLINVQERIQLYYGAEYGLIILSEEGKGTQVDIVLPAHRQEENINEVNTDVENTCGG